MTSLDVSGSPLPLVQADPKCKVCRVMAHLQSVLNDIGHLQGEPTTGLSACLRNPGSGIGEAAESY